MSIVVITTALNNLHAQEIITVSGKILNQPEAKSKPEPFIEMDMHVFAFNSIIEAKKAIVSLNNGENNIMYDMEAIPDLAGYYEIRVAENGALIMSIGSQPILIEVNGNKEINYISNSVFLMSLSHPMMIIDWKPRKPHHSYIKILNDKLCSESKLYFPKDFTGIRRRLIIMPYVVDCATNETIANLDTMVIDGIKYIPPRKKIANKKKGDPLSSYVNPNRKMDKNDFSITIKDTLCNINPDKNYKVAIKIKIEDHTNTVYEDEFRPSSCKAKRPFMFIEPIDTTNQLLKEAFNQCIKGDYDYRNASNMQELDKRKRIFELVKNSSPMNHAVMCMAMETSYFDKEAKEVLDKMEQTTQVKYMKLQLFIRENKLYEDPLLVEPFSREELNFNEACKMLDLIIKEDSKFRKIAENDGEFTQEFMNYYADPFNWEDLEFKYFGN